MSSTTPFIKGLVSIILPTYNRYEFLLCAIRSCLAQTYPSLEIIVIDDASTDPRYTDGSLEHFPHTTLIRLPLNQRAKYGVTSAQGMTRQEGIRLARGEWLAFLDDDDTFYPEKLERQLQEMTLQNATFSSTNMTRIHHTSPTTFISKGPYFPFSRIPSLMTLSLIQHTNYINNSTVMIHRDIVRKTGEFRPVIYEDWEYWKRALEHCSCLYLQEELTRYTVSADPNLYEKHYV